MAYTVELRSSSQSSSVLFDMKTKRKEIEKYAASEPNPIVEPCVVDVNIIMLCFVYHAPTEYQPVKVSDSESLYWFEARQLFQKPFQSCIHVRRVAGYSQH